jgi:hypothetical protein
MCHVQRGGVTYTRVILGIEKYDEIGRIDVTVDVYMDVSCWQHIRFKKTFK